MNVNLFSISQLRLHAAEGLKCPALESPSGAGEGGEALEEEEENLVGS